MNNQVKKPINRSGFRLFLGKSYYRVKRYFLWYFSRIKFAYNKQDELAYEYYCHKTPLLRKLRNVDMYLQYNKIVNLKIAIEKINNVKILPGETFSYWRLIGKPTKNKGYLDGMILNKGAFIAGIGGGLCQLSNLIYWITIHTPLTVTERHRHGYDVFPDSDRTQPFGSGATCFYNYIDLMIRNDTKEAYQLSLKMTEQDLIGLWKTDTIPKFKYEVYEKQHYFKSEYWGGYTRHNLIYRKKFDMDSNLIEDEYVIENHAIMMYSPFISQNDSSDFS